MKFSCQLETRNIAVSKTFLVGWTNIFLSDSGDQDLTAHHVQSDLDLHWPQNAL